MKLFLKFMFTAITICIVTIIAVLYLLQESLIFPAPVLDGSEAKIEGFKPVSIPTPDGETLASYYRQPDENQATILIFHGNGDAAAYQQIKANKLASAGFGVLLVEYRGYGGSTGSPTEAGLYIDGKASYDFVRKMNDTPIGLYAHSLGTGVAIELATKRKIFALVLESPYDSLQAVAQNRMPWVPMDLLLKHKFRSDKIIGQIDVPILIMHGTNDNVIPIEHGKNLMKVAPAATTFLEISGAGHNNMLNFGTAATAIKFLNKAPK